MAINFSPDAHKLAESRENLAKFQEEAGQVKIEVVAEKNAFVQKINEATTYQITPADIEGGDKPKTPQEQVESDFGMDLRTLREYQNPQKEEAYHKLYNDPTLRAKYDKKLAEYEKELKRLDNSAKYSQEIMALYGERGKGVGEKEQQEASDNVTYCFYEGIKIEKKIKHLKHLLAPEADMIGKCTIENKSQEVKDWETKHQMEIVKHDDWESIVVMHDGDPEPVSNIIGLDDLKSPPILALIDDVYVFIYATARKAVNIIKYYKSEDDGLIKDSEASGTRKLFTIDKSKLVINN